MSPRELDILARHLIRTGRFPHPSVLLHALTDGLAGDLTGAPMKLARPEGLPPPRVYVSPNDREGASTVADAKANWDSEKAKRLRQTAASLPGHAAAENAFGAWTDGAEEAQVHYFTDAAGLKEKAAKLGVAGNQKAVLTFAPGNGPGRLHVVTQPHADPVKTYTTAAKHGIEFLTIVPGEKTDAVHVVDSGDSLAPAVQTYAREVGGSVVTHPGTAEYLGHDTDRAEGQRILRGVAKLARPVGVVHSDPGRAVVERHGVSTALRAMGHRLPNPQHWDRYVDETTRRVGELVRRMPKHPLVSAYRTAAQTLRPDSGVAGVVARKANESLAPLVALVAHAYPAPTKLARFTKPIDKPLTRAGNDYSSANQTFRVGRLFAKKTSEHGDPLAEINGAKAVRLLGLHAPAIRATTHPRAGDILVMPAIKGKPIARLNPDEVTKVDPGHVAGHALAAWLIGAGDRHSGNYMVDEQHRLHGIDYGLTFHPKTELGPPTAGGPVRSVDDVRRYHQGVPASLVALLTNQERARQTGSAVPEGGEPWSQTNAYRKAAGKTPIPDDVVANAITHEGAIRDLASEVAARYGDRTTGGDAVHAATALAQRYAALKAVLAEKGGKLTLRDLLDAEQRVENL